MCTAPKGSLFNVFPITAAGVVPCGGPKQSSRISSIVQIIFSFWPFEISEGILRNQTIIIGLDSFSNKGFNIFGPIWFLLVSVLATLLKNVKLQ